MPITRDKLIKLCKSLDLEPDTIDGEDDTIFLLYGTDCFVNLEGEKNVLIWCSAGYEGTYLAVSAPRVLNLTDCKYKGAVFAAMAEIGLRTKYLQLTYNPKNGEVHFECEVPVEDGTVTARQLEVLITGTVSALDAFYPVLKHAMETGKVDFDLCWEPEEE